DGVVTTLAGDPDGLSGFNDGVERVAGLQNPTDVAIGADGSIWISDSYNNKLRKLSFYELPSDITADGAVKVMKGDSRIDFDAQPENIAGRVFVPVRLIAEPFGYEVKFNDNEIT